MVIYNNSIMKLSYQKLINPQHGPITKFAVKSNLSDPLEDVRYCRLVVDLKNRT